MNLCTNAYHAMREKGGILGVALKQVDIAENDRKVVGRELAAGPYIEIEISDTGCGMGTQTVEKIFEPYFTTKKKGQWPSEKLLQNAYRVKVTKKNSPSMEPPDEGTRIHGYRRWRIFFPCQMS